jgi:MFS family permease
MKTTLNLRWSQMRASPATQVMMGLLGPTILTGLDAHLFAVALPAVRHNFGIDADMTAWVAMIYTLPFMTLMPLYGRLGDGLGKRRLLLLGTACFLLGTSMVLAAPTLGWFMLGRAIQGVGAAGFVPLAIAIIAEVFAPSERGRVLGAWNSVIPLIGLIMPYFGGLFVDQWGWRANYPLILLASVVSLLAVSRYIPVLPTRATAHFLRTFDWVGVLLLSGALATLLVFTSSRPITGIPALQDWRLLGICLACFAGLVGWERRQRLPYVSLQLFANRTFTLASICAGLRMFLMSSISFLLPLYLTDIHGLSASAVGSVLALQAGALFAISYAGGDIADRWGSRWPVAISMIGLVVVMVLLATLPATTPVWLLYVVAGFHGLLIGISLAPLHRAAMQEIAPSETGMAAGLYSMIRFAGQILGTALAGVFLQRALAHVAAPIAAYQSVYWIFAAAAVVNVFMGWGLRDE